MLSPLQEVASRIYAAKINAYRVKPSNGFIATELDYEMEVEINLAVTEAKALLEACKEAETPKGKRVVPDTDPRTLQRQE